MCSGCGGGYLCQVLESTSVGLRAVWVWVWVCGCESYAAKEAKEQGVSVSSVSTLAHSHSPSNFPPFSPVAAVPSARRLLPNRRNALNRMSGWSG